MLLGEEDVRVDEFKGGIVGGDQAIFEVRRSWLDGIAILRTTSRVARHRICKRAPWMHAVCVAVGDGTDSVVAGSDQRLRHAISLDSHLSCSEISIFSIAVDMERWA